MPPGRLGRPSRGCGSRRSPPARPPRPSVSGPAPFRGSGSLPGRAAPSRATGGPRPPPAGPLDVALRVPGGDVLPLVVQLLAAGKPDFHLHAGALQVEL